MSFKVNSRTIEDSPTQRQTPLGVFSKNNIRDSIGKVRESEVSSSLEKKKTFPAIRNRRVSQTNASSLMKHNMDEIKMEFSRKDNLAARGQIGHGRNLSTLINFQH